jgi:hypothetical protein
LVAVVLRDRDDEAQVGLDHPLLGLHVAALDPLRQLDLLGRRQERVAAGLAQEELERVSGRLERRLQRRGRRRRRWRLGVGALVLGDLDRPLVELAV